jgi:hypothetical protein
MNFLKSALQTELELFFQSIDHEEVATPKVTDSAFCQARLKLKHPAFIEMNDQQLSDFYREFPVQTWHEFRLLAIDGSTLQVPHTEEVADHFGGLSFSNGAECPMARTSQLCDVLNHITLRAILSPYSQSEREHLISLLRELTEKDLLLLDRGYPAFWVFALIRSTRAHFCARVIPDHWKIVKEFTNSNQKETIVTLHASKDSIHKCLELGLAIDPLQLRLIRVELENGEVEILATSLLDTKAFPSDLFQGLYHGRWDIEEHYKKMKHRIQMENYSGKSKESVYQDFHAKIFSLNLTAILVHPAQDSVNRERSQKKYPYKVNFTKALSNMKNTIVLLFTRSYTVEIVQKLFALFCKNTQPVRPNRKYSRKRKLRNRTTYSFVYKPTL